MLDVILLIALILLIPVEFGYVFRSASPGRETRVSRRVCLVISLLSFAVGGVLLLGFHSVYALPLLVLGIMMLGGAF